MSYSRMGSEKLNSTPCAQQANSEMKLTMKTKAQVKPAARIAHRAGFTFSAKPVVQPRSNTSERTVSEPALYNAPQVGHAFGAFDIHHTATPTIQPKLTVGPVNDHYEQEADRVAQQVVGQINQPAMQRQEMPKEEEEELQTKALASTVQRQEMPEEEDELQTKPLADSIQRQETPEEEELQTKRLANTLQRQDEPEEEELQTKPELQRRADGSMAAPPAVEGAIHQARGSGQPLPDATRQPMERAFGADFSRVKVHTDAQADQLNRSIQARAFTTGSDIFFRQGEHSPGTQAGQELLAHELTHVVQQGGNTIQRDITLHPTVVGGKLRINPANDLPNNDGLNRNDAHPTLNILNESGRVVQRTWDNVTGPDPFDGFKALEKAEWTNPYYVAVNLGKKQPKEAYKSSYRMTVWAPAKVSDAWGVQWTVCAVAHGYFETNSRSKKVTATGYGHAYINSWAGQDYEVPQLPTRLVNMYMNEIIGNIKSIQDLRSVGLVSLVGAYPANRTPKMSSSLAELLPGGF